MSKPTANEDEPAPLCARASYYFAPKRLARYVWAMADVLCWLDGFQAAGKDYSPGSLEILRELSESLKSIQDNEPRGDSYAHERETIAPKNQENP